MKKFFALLLVALAAIFWAGSGLAAQDFFEHSNRNAMELTNIRMLLAGSLLLLLSRQLGGATRSLKVLRETPRLWVDIFLYGVVGILFMQFSYFQGIALGNAAATTVIQYTCPAMVICYESIRRRHLPRIGEIGSVLFAVTGIFLLVTGGHPERLSVPLDCFLWSLASGAFFAFSSIYPRHLLFKMDPCFLLAMGMLSGGAVSCALVSELDWSSFFKPEVRGDLAFIVLLGTAAAFMLFNAGLLWLSPEEATITATIEPAASVILASLLFNITFGWIESIGILMVLIAILMPLISKEKV